MEKHSSNEKQTKKKNRKDDDLRKPLEACDDPGGDSLRKF